MNTGLVKSNKNIIYVSFVVNFEEGAEISYANGDTINNATYDGHDYIPGYDLCLKSHFDYAIDTGITRVRNIFTDYGLNFTMSCCGLSVEKYPKIVHSTFNDGNEISAHGWRWESHYNKTIGDELKIINRTKDVIKNVNGEYPLGWHTRSSSSINTRNLLYKSGFVYDSDDYSSERPYIVTDFKQPYVVIPYSFDTNDMQFLSSGKFLNGEDFFNYIKSSIEWLEDENWTCDRNYPIVVSVGLHPRIIGRPARVGGLSKLLSWLSKRDNIIICRRIDIARLVLSLANADVNKNSK